MYALRSVFIFVLETFVSHFFAFILIVSIKLIFVVRNYFCLVFIYPLIQLIFPIIDKSYLLFSHAFLPISLNFIIPSFWLGLLDMIFYELALVLTDRVTDQFTPILEEVKYQSVAFLFYCMRRRSSQMIFRKEFLCYLDFKFLGF